MQGCCATRVGVIGVEDGSVSGSCEDAAGPVDGVAVWAGCGVGLARWFVAMRWGNKGGRGEHGCVCRVVGSQCVGNNG